MTSSAVRKSQTRTGDEQSKKKPLRVCRGSRLRLYCSIRRPSILAREPKRQCKGSLVPCRRSLPLRSRRRAGLQQPQPRGPFLCCTILRNRVLQRLHAGISKRGSRAGERRHTLAVTVCLPGYSGKSWCWLDEDAEGDGADADRNAVDHRVQRRGND
jgi:hypothetical protein